jgi:hypothetical protein
MRRLAAKAHGRKRRKNRRRKKRRRRRRRRRAQGPPGSATTTSARCTSATRTSARPSTSHTRCSSWWGPCTSSRWWLRKEKVFAILFGKKVLAKDHKPEQNPPDSNP